MAQLRRDFADFEKRNVEVIILGPDSARSFQRFWNEQDMPFIGLADEDSVVADLYLQEVNLLKLGRMPATFIIDLEGYIRFVHYGDGMWDTSNHDEILKVIDTLY